MDKRGITATGIVLIIVGVVLGSGVVNNLLNQGNAGFGPKSTGEPPFTPEPPFNPWFDGECNCPSDTPVCGYDPYTGEPTCYGCTEDSHCPADQLCLYFQCQDIECFSSEDCSAGQQCFNYHCQDIEGWCDEPSDCQDPSHPYCVQNNCAECTEDSHCPSINAPYCFDGGEGDFYCVECIENSHCLVEFNEYCYYNECYPAPPDSCGPESEFECPPGWDCLNDIGECVRYCDDGGDYCPEGEGVCVNGECSSTNPCVLLPALDRKSVV